MSAPEKMRYKTNARGILFIVSPESGKNKKIAAAAPRALRIGNFTIDSIVDSDAMWITLTGYPHRLDNPSGCPHSPQHYGYYFYQKTY